jgi:spore coat protein U-like protein
MFLLFAPVLMRNVRRGSIFLLQLFFLSSSAWGAITCSLTAQSLSAIYISTANSDVQANLSMTCTRLATDPTSTTYRLYVNNGMYDTPPGSLTAQRRAQHSTTSGTYINYGIYRNSTRTQDWRFPPTGTTNVVTGTFNFGTATTLTVNRAYYLRVPTGQTTVPAGNYYDTLNAYMRYPNSDAGALTTAAPFTVGVGVGSQCLFGRLPGNITLNYTAFRTTQLTATTTFTKVCTSGLAYSIAISPASGTLVGLPYTLTVSTPSGAGTGAAQTHTITGRIVANRAGTCTTANCSATATHTVTITY